MASSHRFGFDPDTPAAQKLLRAARANEPTEIVITRGLQIVGDRAYGPGERATAGRAFAESLISMGVARRYGDPA